MNAPDWVLALPAVNAGLNSLAGLLLVLGYVQIRRGWRVAHKRTMLIAFARDEPAWQAVTPLFGRPDLADEEVGLLREALEASGARRRLEKEIEREGAHVLSLIGAARLPSGLAAELRHAVRTGMEREA